MVHFCLRPILLCIIKKRIYIRSSFVYMMSLDFTLPLDEQHVSLSSWCYQLHQQVSNL